MNISVGRVIALTEITLGRQARSFALDHIWCFCNNIKSLNEKNGLFSAFS